MYTIQTKTGAHIVSDAEGEPLYWYVHDTPREEIPSSERSGQLLLSKYLKDACTVLKSEIDILADASCEFTEANEKQLIFMLKSIITARKIWQEEESRMDGPKPPICE